MTATPESVPDNSDAVLDAVLDGAVPTTANTSAAPTRPVLFSREAVFTLMSEHQAGLERFVARLLSSDADCAKVVNCAWAETVRRWKRLGELDQPEKLLFTIARLRCADRRRQVSQHPVDMIDLTEDENTLNDAAEALRSTPEFESELIARLDMRTALRALPPRQRQALVYTYALHDDLPQHVIAALLGTTPSKLANLLRSGRNHLAKSIHLAGYQTTTVPREVRR